MQTAVETEMFEAAQYLKRIAATPALEGVLVNTVVMHGPTASTILSIVLSHKVDLVVICSRGYTGMTRWVMGSIADKVSRHSSVPVLVLRDAGPQPFTREGMKAHPTRALVALDGSNRAMAAIQPAAALIAAMAAPERGALHLASVVKPVLSELEGEDGEQYPFNLSHSEHELLEATRYLSTAVEHLCADRLGDTVDVTWSAIIDTDVARGIVRMAESYDGLAKESDQEDEFDVIAISTHGHGGVQSWVTGSVSQRVLNATRLPLLIVRPPDMIKLQDAMMEHISITTVAEMHIISTR
jgi:nucleotide-binding universal stress UspA family protein